ncbi:MAG: hypothetical protein F4Z55_06675 [Boseongicola sp. SB0667_bin_21]|nr:hypothetical protein [Boseongicola sp. SB0667_bin_21]
MRRNRQKGRNRDGARVQVAGLAGTAVPASVRVRRRSGLVPLPGFRRRRGTARPFRSGCRTPHRGARGRHGAGRSRIAGAGRARIRCLERSEHMTEFNLEDAGATTHVRRRASIFALAAALMFPGASVAQESLSGAGVAQAAGTPATVLPNRVVVTFGEDIPRAYCAPARPCHIELEPAEELTDNPSWGDTLGWQVTSRVHGRDPATVVVIAMPVPEAPTTSLVIPTDRRLYWIELVNSTVRHTAILSFKWPDTVVRERLAAAERRIEELMVEVENEVGRIRVDAETLGKGRNPLQYHSPVDRAAGLRPTTAPEGIGSQ